jgi:hypothetical protein
MWKSRIGNHLPPIEIQLFPIEMPDDVFLGGAAVPDKPSMRGVARCSRSGLAVPVHHWQAQARNPHTGKRVLGEERLSFGAFEEIGVQQQRHIPRPRALLRPKALSRRSRRRGVPSACNAKPGIRKTGSFGVIVDY